MRDEDKGDSRIFLDFFQLLLHILAQLEVERAQRLVQQQHLRLIDQCAGDGDALLLTSGKAGHAALCKAGEHDHFEHAVDFFA